MNVRVNGEKRRLEFATIDQLLRLLAIPEQGVAVAVEGEVVRRAEWPLYRIQEGQSVEIVRAVQGG